MSTLTQVVGVLLAVFMLFLVLELVRRRRLRVGYSLTWLLIGSGVMVLIAVPPILNLLTRLLGMSDPRSLLFTAGIGFSFWILLDHSLTLTKLWRQDKNVAQQHALLEWKVRQLEMQLDELTEAHLRLLESQAPAFSLDGLKLPVSAGGDAGHAMSYQLEDAIHEPEA